MSNEFVVALNSGKPFRQLGSVCGEGEPLWWERHEVSEMFRGMDANRFSYLTSRRHDWEIKGNHEDLVKLETERREQEARET